MAAASAQAEDETIWFQARTITEAYLQNAIRNLHTVIESYGQNEIGVLVLTQIIAQSKGQV